MASAISTPEWPRATPAFVLGTEVGAAVAEDDEPADAEVVMDIDDEVVADFDAADDMDDADAVALELLALVVIIELEAAPVEEAIELDAGVDDGIAEETAPVAPAMLNCGKKLYSLGFWSTTISIV